MYLKSKFSTMMNIEQDLISAISTISSKIDDAISYLNLAMYSMHQQFCFPFISAPSIQLILCAMSFMSYESLLVMVHYCTCSVATFIADYEFH